MIKTPKNLDTTNVFDFLGLPPPGTPRSKLFRDRSPNHPGDCYSGRDQRLSPRLSPRFPIPEAPTDLSGRPPPASKANDSIPSEAEDLSTKSKSLSNQNAQHPLQQQQQQPQQQQLIVQPPPQQHQLQLQLHQKPQQQQQQQVLPMLPQVKREYDQSPPRCTPPLEHPSSLRMPAMIKSESPVANIAATSATANADDYDYNPHPNHQHVQPCFPNSFYLGFNQSYQRQPYLHHDLVERPSPPRTASPQRPFDRSGYHQQWPGVASHPLHFQQQQQQQHHLLQQHHPHHAGYNTHPWSTPIKEEPSLTPPPPSASAPPAHFSPYNNTILSNKSSLSERKRSGRKTSNESNDNDERRGRKKGKAKAGKELAGSGESKRVYTCPHCQRAYDWNYNLNRHLKYECGKENAFQVSVS